MTARRGARAVIPSAVEGSALCCHPERSRGIRTLPSSRAQSRGLQLAPLHPRPQVKRWGWHPRLWCAKSRLGPLAVSPRAPRQSVAVPSMLPPDFFLSKGRFACALLLLALADCRGQGAASGATGRDLAITRVMADPAAVADDRGEWIELTNTGTVAADLYGWELRSANDAGYVVRQSVVVPPSGTVLLARAPDAVRGTRPALVYNGIILGNNADWLVLRDPGGTTRDSLAWRSPPRGVALEHRRTIGTPGDSSARENARA